MGAAVNLGADLSLRYYVRVNDPTLLSGGALSMRFTIDGKTVDVTEYVISGGEYVFMLSGIAPQQIADTVNASVLVNDTVITEYNGYSIKRNCLNLLEKTASQLGISDAKYAAMKALIQDLLIYGQAAQDYVSYNPEAPVLDGTEGITASDALPTEEDAMVLEGNTNATLYLSSCTVRFDTVNKLRFKIYVGVADIENVTLSVNGTAYAVSDLLSLGNGFYTLTTDAILATEFDTVYNVVLSYNGSAYATLEYSVNAYVYSMYTSTKAAAATKALALALYRYGISADAFAEAA